MNARVLKPRVVALVVLSFLLVCRPAAAQTGQREFLLRADNLGVSSRALVTADGLQIIASSGEITRYSRDSRYDSQDRQWFGFYSPAAKQILRWPISNSGQLQVGTPQGSSVVYRFSEMTIRPVADTPREPLDRRTVNRPIVPTPQAGAGELLAGLAASKLFDLLTGNAGETPAGSMLRLAMVDRGGSPWLLSRGSGLDVSAVSRMRSSGMDWFVAPVGSGYVRVQSYVGGRVYAVSANQRGQLSLLPASQDPRQLWRVARGRQNNRFVLENVASAGSCLTHIGNGDLGLQPLAFADNQLWAPFAAPVAAPFEPFWRTLSTEVIPNSQLPPAQLQMVNSHRYALIVLLGDVRQGNDFEQIRIEPASAKTIELDRDAGATIVETVEIRSPAGVWDRQQYVTAIPPRAFYDLSVYEEHLQSIAIDATGTSPNVIEDVNYSPKSVGWFPLPAGPDIPAYGRIDLFSQAKAAKNPGGVRRMDPAQFDEPVKTDRLEEILEKIGNAPRKKF